MNRWGPWVILTCLVTITFGVAIQTLVIVARPQTVNYFRIVPLTDRLANPVTDFVDQGDGRNRDGYPVGLTAEGWKWQEITDGVQRP